MYAQTTLESSVPLTFWTACGRFHFHRAGTLRLARSVITSADRTVLDCPNNSPRCAEVNDKGRFPT